MAYAFAGHWGPEPFIDRQGNAKPSSVAYVYLPATLTLADLWTDRDKTVAAPNPFSPDARANGEFYADPGEYRLLVKIGSSTVYDDVITVPIDPEEAAQDDDLADYIPLTQKGAADGVATLDSGSRVPTAQLPALAITDTFVVNTQAAMLALAAERGDVAIRTDLFKSFILATDSPGTLADWKELLTPTDEVSQVEFDAHTALENPHGTELDDLTDVDLTMLQDGAPIRHGQVMVYREGLWRPDWVAPSVRGQIELWNDAPEPVQLGAMPTVATKIYTVPAGYVFKGGVTCANDTAAAIVASGWIVPAGGAPAQANALFLNHSRAANSAVAQVLNGSTMDEAEELWVQAASASLLYRLRGYLIKKSNYPGLTLIRASLVTAEIVVYTCPAGKVAIFPLTEGTAIPMVLSNVGAATTTIRTYHTTDGLKFLRSFTSVGVGGGVNATANIGKMQAGDTFSVSSSTANQVNVWGLCIEEDA